MPAVSTRRAATGGGGGGGGVGGGGRPVQWTTIGDSLQTAAVPTSSPLH